MCVYTYTHSLIYICVCVFQYSLILNGIQERVVYWLYRWLILASLLLTAEKYILSHLNKCLNECK